MADISRVMEYHFSRLERGRAAHHELDQPTSNRSPTPESDRWCSSRWTSRTRKVALRYCGRTASASSAVAGDWMIVATGSRYCLLLLPSTTRPAQGLIASLTN